jgi:hypothetical protein
MSQEQETRLAAMRKLNSASGEFARIKARLSEFDQPSSQPLGAGQELLGLAKDLSELLQIEIEQNERLTAFAMGAEEAGFVSRAELDILMGLR